MTVTRFAPSPTGYLHLGHAASALFAYQAAQKTAGRFILRIEDIDPVRCKPEFTDAIFEDLRWLGLSWEEPVRIQSKCMPDYECALKKLDDMGLIYPCYCTRKEVLAEAALAGYAPHLPSDSDVGPVYPGTCRILSPERRAELASLRAPVWRLNMQAAVAQAGALVWHDLGKGVICARPERFGDVVLARKDVRTSYHLSVVLDDALQGVTLVTRGEDLFPVTDIHRLLQALLGLSAPVYHHHALLTNGGGVRLAKRDQAQTLRFMRQNGQRPQDVWARVAGAL